jgi:hypothetical protein
VVIPFFSYWGKNRIRSWAGGNDIEFPAPPFRVQSSEKQSAEDEDDYGTNPTHEPTETRCSREGQKRRPYRGQRNERHA